MNEPRLGRGVTHPCAHGVCAGPRRALMELLPAETGPVTQRGQAVTTPAKPKSVCGLLTSA